MSSLPVRKLTIDQKRTLLALGLSVVGLVAYGAFLTKHYDHNFVPWVSCLQSPDCSGTFFFYPQHLLHLPAEYVVFRVWILLGFSGSAVLPMQLTTAMMGAISAGLLFLLITEVIRSLPAAVFATLAWLFSYGMWIVHTDGWYHPLGNAFFFFAAWWLLRSAKGVNSRVKPSARDPGWLSVLPASFAFSLALLFSQLTLLYLPGLLLAIFLGDDLKINASRIRSAFSFCAVVALVTASVYLIIGVSYLDYRTPDQFISWIFFTHAGLPGWGQLSWERVADIAVDTLGAFVPIRAGIGFRDLLRGQVTGSFVPAQLSVLIFPAFVCLILAAAIRLWKQIWMEHKRLVLLCLAWLIPGYLFQSWYEPQALFISLPSFSLWMLIALVLDKVGHGSVPGHARILRVGSTLALVIIVVGNFTGAIWPRHSSFSLDYQKAAQASVLMTEKDVLLSPTYSWWGAYIPLFPGRDCRSLVMIARAEMTHDEVQALIWSIIAETHGRGGRVFFADASQYSEEQWKWLVNYGGLPFYREDFDRFTKRVAWTLMDGEVVWEVLGIGSDSAQDLFSHEG